MRNCSEGTYQWVKGGKSYFDLLISKIDQSSTSIVLHTYILKFDTTGIEVLNALKKARKKGVLVQILMDGFGSKDFPEQELHSLKSTGIEIRKFSPNIIGNLQIGRRLHYKVSIFDQKSILIGGINISDKYNDLKQPAWLDYAMFVQDVNLALNCHKICLDFFSQNRFDKSIIKQSDNLMLLVNDWVDRKSEIKTKIADVIRNSNQDILITGTYFFPSGTIKKELIRATKRGVNIKLILGKKSDIPILYRATRYLYKWLCKHNVEIYEWNHSVLHAKVLLSDQKNLVIGSYNINPLSKYGGIEMSLYLEDEKETTSLYKHLNTEVIPNCMAILPRDIKNNSFISELFDGISYYLTRLFYHIIKKVDDLSK